MKDAKGHGSEARGATTRGSGAPYTTPTVQEAARPGVRTPGGWGPQLSQDNLDTMKTIADLRARMSGTGPGHQAALKQGIDNLRDLRGVSVERGGGRVR